MNKVGIQNKLNKINSYIDYKVGDWVETCNMLPGILNKIIFLMKNNENKYKKFINFENNLDK